jgi:hypothetical protein
MRANGQTNFEAALMLCGHYKVRDRKRARNGGQPSWTCRAAHQGLNEGRLSPQPQPPRRSYNGRGASWGCDL